MRLRIRKLLTTPATNSELPAFLASVNDNASANTSFAKPSLDNPKCDLISETLILSSSFFLSKLIEFQYDRAQSLLSALDPFFLTFPFFLLCPKPDPDVESNPLSSLPPSFSNWGFYCSSHPYFNLFPPLFRRLSRLLDLIRPLRWNQSYVHWVLCNPPYWNQPKLVVVPIPQILHPI